MLALCLMLLATYYAQNYAGIIGWSLVIGGLYRKEKSLTVYITVVKIVLMKY